jgi:hypothetical protein
MIRWLFTWVMHWLVRNGRRVGAMLFTQPVRGQRQPPRPSGPRQPRPSYFPTRPPTFSAD